MANTIRRCAEASLSAYRGPRIDASWSEHLVDQPVVLTSDHHALQTFPILIQGNLAFCIPDLLDERAVVRVSLAGCMVPLSNRAVGRGGIHFTDCEGKEKRLPLFPDRLRDVPVLTTPAFDRQAVDTALRLGRAMRIRNEISATTWAALGSLMGDVVSSARVLAQPDFVSQVSVANAHVWNLVNRSPRTALLHVGLDVVVTDWLIDELRTRPGELIATALLDPTWRHDLATQLDGVMTCWRAGGESGGTFLFWGIHEGKLVSLHEERSELVGRGVAVRLDATSLADALASRTIIPGSFLLLVILSLYCGFSCVGGFNQSTYLAAIRERWASFLASRGAASEATLVSSVPTPMSTGVILALARRGELLVPASGVDLMACGGVSKAHLARAAMHPVSDLLIPSLAEIARTILRHAPGAERVASWIRTAGLEDLVVEGS